MSLYPKVTLKPGRESSLKRLHPWVFSGAIQEADDRSELGDLVSLHDANGLFLGIGYTCSQSIAVRLLSFKEERLDREFWRNRIAEILQFRAALRIPADTTAYRLIHGEGDQIPGLIADRYGDMIVIQAHTYGALRIAEELAPILQELTGVSSIYCKSSETLPDEETPEGYEDRFLVGDREVGPVEILEGGLRYGVDTVSGQKTGFFIDQRDNRALIRRLSAGKRVLNTFCYTGGFSVAALAGGAAEVVSIDSSRSALFQLEANLKLNEFSGQHETITADVFKFFEEKIQEDSPFDIIVVDPPAFVKHRGALEQGLRGYRRINQAALQKVAPGGFLFTFSCSQLVTQTDFQKSLFQAAIGAGRSIRVVAQLRQAGCHPVNLFHPEGEYLKGLLLYVG